MAFERKENSQTNGNNTKKAQAYVNLEVIDKAGNPHKVKAYIPLHEDDGQVSRSLIAAARENPDFTIDMKAEVRLAKEDDGSSDLFI